LTSVFSERRYEVEKLIFLRSIITRLPMTKGTTDRPILGLAAIMNSGQMDFDLGTFNRCFY